MKYIEIQPGIQLSSYVKCYWMLSGEAYEYAPEGIAPDGCVEMILNLAAPFTRHYVQGRTELQPASFIVGQMRTAVIVQPTGRVEILGVRFHPHGFYRFIRQDIDEFTDKTLNCVDVWGRSIRLLEEQIRDAPHAAEKVAILEAFLLRLVEGEKSPGKTYQSIANAIQLVQSSAGLRSVENIALAVGMSARHLERQFKSIVGLSPKSFERVVRFQRALKLIQNGEVQGAGVAIDCGYYDQAHFIHDFKTFTGYPPSAYSAEIHRMSQFFSLGEPVGFLQYAGAVPK